MVVMMMIIINSSWTVRVQPRKFRLDLNVVHESPGFVGEMLKFKVTIVNQEVHRVINVR